jgi:hypothetical protein
MSIQCNSKLASTAGFSVFFALAQTFCLVLPRSSMAADVVYGRGPVPVPYGSDVEPSSYTLQSEVGCPTPTFRVAGFAGGANDWANNYGPNASSDSGLGNYGISAGVSFPLGRQLSDFCREYAQQRILFEQQRVRNMTLNSQYSFFKYCRALVDSGLGSADTVVASKLKGDKLFSDPAFESNGPLSAFASCKPLYSLLRNRDPNRFFPAEKDPSPASTQPMVDPAQNVFGVNRPR